MKWAKRIFNIRTMPYFLILPATVLIFGIVLFPILRVFWLSMFEYNTAFNRPPTFVSFQNYKNIFTTDKIFSKVLLNSCKWVVSEVVLQLVLGLITALLLNQKFRGRAAARSVSLIPWAVSGVLTAILWSLIFNEHIGVLNDLLLRLGLISRKAAWLGDFKLVFGSVVTAELWRGIPFFTISLLAAMQSIPLELYEAARIDGGSAVKLLWYVTLPHIKDTIILTTLLRTVWEFNSVDVIFNLTGGGPANQTMTLSMYIANEAVKGSNFGYGSALSIISFLILTVFAVLYLRLSGFAREE